MKIDICSALVRATSFVEMLQVVKNAKEDITFFGHRYIYHPNYEGILSIDAFALHFKMLRRKNYLINQGDDDEKEAFYALIPRISQIYKKNDARQNNPIFTYLQDQWRFLFVYTASIPRSFWNKYYDYYEFNFSERGLPLNENLISQLTREKIHLALTNTTTLTELLPLVEKAKENISFLGWRHLTCDGYDESVPLTALAARVMELAQDTLPNEEILSQIDDLFLQNDERLMEKNFFTRMLCILRDTWEHLFNPQTAGSRDAWEGYKLQMVDVQ